MLAKECGAIAYIGKNMSSTLHSTLYPLEVPSNPAPPDREGSWWVPSGKVRKLTINEFS
jgi:hypothetical protein